MNETRPKSAEGYRHARSAGATPLKKNYSEKVSRVARKSITGLGYRRPQAKMHRGPQSNFGKDAPRICIGCSRQEPVFGNRNPGPGAYTPKDPGECRKIYYKIPKAVEKPRKPDTADVEFINRRSFPNIVPKTISNTGHKDYFSFDPSIPGPGYVPPSTISSKGHKITPLRAQRKPDESVPGPGHYSPKYDQPKVSFFYSTARRNTDFHNKTDSPGPGAYSPNFYAELSVEPRWSIGKKGRYRKRRKCDPPEVPKGKLIGIGNVHIQLEPSMDEDDVLRFVSEHPELKHIVSQIIDRVLAVKPEKPLEAIRDYFMKFRAE
jgi:hypothetical protein